MNKRKSLGPLIVLAMLLGGCSSVKIEPVDFGWPVESALTVSDQGTVEETRYGIEFNVSPLAAKELGEPGALNGTTLRLLRSSDGYYFITAPRFQSVYVFSSAEGRLVLAKAIKVSETGLDSPALNQRSPWVELVDGAEFRRLLTRKGIVEEKGEEKKEGGK